MTRVLQAMLAMHADDDNVRRGSMLAPMVLLAEWLRWVAEASPSFRDPDTDVGAVVSDLYERLVGAPAAAAVMHALETETASASQRRWALRACQVLAHPSLVETKPNAHRLDYFFVEELAELAAAAAPETLDSDDERREELVRRALRAVKSRPAGETEADFDDRLGQVDSVARRRVLADAEAREHRAKEAREALAQKAAEEAVPKVGRE